MPEKVLVHIGYPTWRKQLLMGFARAQELKDQGNEVAVTYCANKAGTCVVNYVGSPVTCQICQAAVRRTGERMGLEMVPLEPPATNAPSDKLTLRERKGLLEGVYSGIVSTFRTLPKDIRGSKMLSAIKRRYFRTSAGLLLAMKSLIRSRNVTRVEVFNGRHACSKFTVLAARGEGIQFTTFEINSGKRPLLFEGHMIHDRKFLQKKILEFEPDFELAEAFYSQRRLPRTNKSAKKHSKTYVPPTGKGFQKKISIFLSSQDEFEALGREWKSPFDDYAKTVYDICRTNPNHFFCIRFHPNQADITSDITSPFRQVEELPNTQVYYPTDTANTYTLIDWSDLVITFGSTVAVEACWSGKASVILGPSFYDELNVSYIPANLEELNELIEQDLPAKDRTNAARLAAFERMDGEVFKYLNCRDGKMTPHGFRLALAPLRRLANYGDDIMCNIVKAWVGANNSQKRRAA